MPQDIVTAVPVPSLRVQTVLYRNDPTEVEGFLDSMATSVALARHHGAVERVSVAVGDCSPEPVIGDGRHLHEWLEKLGFDTAKYCFFEANLGSAGGHNQLFEDLTEDLVVVSNADGYASPRLVTELLSPFDEDNVGVVEARQVPLEQPKVHDPVTGDTSWASGACFAARAKMVHDIGGFDADLFFLYCDDVDFSWRARLAGWRVVHRAAARFYHDKRLTLEGTLQTTSEEIRCSLETSVLLPWRYARPDIAERNLAMIERSPDAGHRALAADLRRRHHLGQLPEPLDTNHQVAQFVGADYAEHRFRWS